MRAAARPLAAGALAAVPSESTTSTNARGKKPQRGVSVCRAARVQCRVDALGGKLYSIFYSQINILKCGILQELYFLGYGLMLY